MLILLFSIVKRKKEMCFCRYCEQKTLKCDCDAMYMLRQRVYIIHCREMYNFLTRNKKEVRNIKELCAIPYFAV